MDIIIDGQTFNFSNESDVRVEGGGCDLYIEEPGFEKNSEEKIGHFTSKPISLPSHVEYLVKRTGETPCSKVFQDANNKKRLYTYFD